MQRLLVQKRAIDDDEAMSEYERIKVYQTLKLTLGGMFLPMVGYAREDELLLDCGCVWVISLLTRMMLLMFVRILFKWHFLDKCCPRIVVQ